VLLVQMVEEIGPVAELIGAFDKRASQVRGTLVYIFFVPFKIING